MAVPWRELVLCWPKNDGRKSEYIVFEVRGRGVPFSIRAQRRERGAGGRDGAAMERTSTRAHGPADLGPPDGRSDRGRQGLQPASRRAVDPGQEDERAGEASERGCPSGQTRSGGDYGDAARRLE